MDIRNLIESLVDNGTLPRIVSNPIAQFGTRERRLIGAEVLPATNVDENEFTEDTVRYRTVVANAGTRYSPVQIKQGVMSGKVEVRCFHTDIGSEFTSRDYDAVIRLLRTSSDLQAAARIVRWLEHVNQGMEELREVYRWQAIESAQVQLRGDNGYTEDVDYSDPAGHRANAGAAWSGNYDPMIDVFAQAQLLADKGFRVSRIITSRNVMSILGSNAYMRNRAGSVVVNVSTGGLVTAGGRASVEQIGGAFRAEGLPTPEIYDLHYQTQVARKRFISDDVLIMVAETGRDFTLELAELNLPEEILSNTLGYTAIGKAAGQSAPGRALYTEAFTRKPPRIEAELWEAIMPVILEPEGIATIKGIA